MEQQIDQHGDWRNGPVAVLVSGGLDSAILLAELAHTSPRVAPVYVRFGLVWEEVEENALRDFLASLSFSSVQPLKTFDMPIAQVYGEHWSTTGRETPAADTPDEAVYLPGRNLLLLAQTAVWCSLQNIPTIAMAPLQANPFPDSSPPFFDAMEKVIQQSVANAVSVVRPYIDLAKKEVMVRGAGLALEKTFSCIRPVDSVHCGSCNKCAERRRAFADAGMLDLTVYATDNASEERHVSCDA